MTKVAKGTSFMDFCMMDCRACSRVILVACIGVVARCSWIEVRGVWAGVEAADEVLFLLDLKRDMVGRDAWFGLLFLGLVW